MHQKYFVYIVRCSDGTLYTGYTTNLIRRVAEHNTQGVRGARYTQGRQPVSLVYHESCSSRSEAMKREIAMKRLSRTEKLLLIDTQADDIDIA